MELTMLGYIAGFIKKKFMYRSCEHVFSRTEHGGDVQAAGQLGEVCAACPPLLHTSGQCASPSPGQLGNPALKLLNTDQDPQHRG